MNLARLAVQLAELPVTIAGTTINRFCGSSMQAIHNAAGAIQMNAGEVFICAGIESMSRVPMGGFNYLPNPSLYKNYPQAYISMGETAENLALQYHIDRMAQDTFALASQQKAAEARKNGLFATEIIPINRADGETVEYDGCIRADTSLQALSELQPAFLKNGSVTAGSSSPLTDGAAAVLVCSEKYADAHGLEKLARIKAIAVSGCAPEIMGIGPVSASRKALKTSRYAVGGHRYSRAERSLCGAIFGSLKGVADSAGKIEPGWRRDCFGPSVGRVRRQNNRQSRQPVETGKQEICAGDPMHRRWPGHSHYSGGYLMDAKTSNIKKVAVIGAGVMGASIAAHVANAGIPVYLLDIVPKEAKNRNSIAEAAIAKLLKAEPAAFMHKNNARLVTPGNVEDHLEWLKDADWVLEAVLEDLAVKQSLYQKLEQICRPDTLISSNTSTLPLKLLTRNMPDSFKQRFMITHFFNPPRYMRLLELVSGAETRPELVDVVSRFADTHLGKDSVTCKDTPGFIGNRIGIYWLQCGLLEAIKLGLTVEQADAVMSAPFGIPKTGIFGLLDLVGLDLIPHVLDGMKLALPKEDAFHQVNTLPPLVQRMIADGYIGRKGKGGFYRLNETSGKRVKESINLQTGGYQPSEKFALPNLPKTQDELRVFLTSDDMMSRFAWQVLSNTLTYSASLIPEISDDIVSVDTAMRLGYNWKYGPFELLDRIGVDWFVGRLHAENRQIPLVLGGASESVQGRFRQTFVPRFIRQLSARPPDGRHSAFIRY